MGSILTKVVLNSVRKEDECKQAHEPGAAAASVVPLVLLWLRSKFLVQR